MTPASNSEARKRALIDRAQKWHATRHERTDPVERLRALADEIAEEDRVGALGWRRWIAGRLYALADEVVPRPPLVSEVIAHLEAGGEVEVYLVVDDRWVECSRSNVTVEDWKKRLAHAGDHPCHGFRLVPKPATERVPLHRVPGRTLPGQEDEVTDIHVQREDRDGVVTAWGRLLAVGCQEVRIPVADDGTVEVLVEDDQ